MSTVALRKLTKELGTLGSKPDTTEKYQFSTVHTKFTFKFQTTFLPTLTLPSVAEITIPQLVIFFNYFYFGLERKEEKQKLKGGEHFEHF